MKRTVQYMREERVIAFVIEYEDDGHRIKRTYDLPLARQSSKIEDESQVQAHIKEVLCG